MALGCLEKKGHLMKQNWLKSGDTSLLVGSFFKSKCFSSYEIVDKSCFQPMSSCLKWSKRLYFIETLKCVSRENQYSPTAWEHGKSEENASKARASKKGGNVSETLDNGRWPERKEEVKVLFMQIRSI